MADTTATPAVKRRASKARAKQANGDGISPAESEALAIVDGEPTAAQLRTTGVAKTAPRLLDVPVALIEPEPDFNPRKKMDPQDLEDLASSLALHGLVQMLLIRPRDRNGPGGAQRFWLTGGHRRFAAAQLAGLKTVPAILRPDGDALVAAVLDNSHRVDLTPLEEAMVYQRAMTEKGLTVRGVAEVLSVSQKRVTERLRILQLPENAQTAVGDGIIGPSWVGWLADLAEKSVLVASVVAQNMVDTGRVPQTHELGRLFDATKGLITPHAIKAGSSAFKLTKDEVKEAVDELASIRNKFSGPEYSWRHGPGRSHVTIGHGEMVQGSTDFLQEGEKVGAVMVVSLPRDGSDRGVWVILDQKWLQAELERRFVESWKSLQEFRKRSRAAQTGSGAGGDTSASAANKAEKARKKAEREQAAKAREQAIEANRRLGKLLMDRFASIEFTTDAAIAVCCAPLHEAGQYGAPSRDDVAGLAAAGLRYLELPEFAHTRELRGKTVDALMTDRKQLAEAFWLWWRKAKTPNEILGRTVIAMLAAHYADRHQAMSAEMVYQGWWMPTDTERALERLLPPKEVRKKGALTEGAAKEKLMESAMREAPDGAPLVDVLDAAGELDDAEPVPCVLCKDLAGAGSTTMGVEPGPGDGPSQVTVCEQCTEEFVGLDDGELLIAIEEALDKPTPTTEPEQEEPAAAAIELDDVEREVLVALHKGKGKGRYGCNTESEVKKHLAEDTGLAARRCGGALKSLRAKRMVGGVLAAPYLNKAYEDLAKTLAIAKGSREGGDEGVTAALKAATA